MLIAVGMRFDDRVTGNLATYAKQAKIIHLDIDPSEFNKNVKVDIPVLGDCKKTLTKLIGYIKENKHTEWIDSFAEHAQTEYARVIEKEVYPKEGPLNMGEVVRAVSEATAHEAILVTDVGQNQMMGVRYFKYKQTRSVVTSGGLGTMGFGLGAAIGGCIANQRKRTVLFTGDGSVGMSLHELATAVSQNLPLLIVIFNNGVLGMVRQWQTMFYDKHYSHTTLNRKTDFPALARAFGAEGRKIASVPELENALESLAADVPTVLDCQVDMDEFVLPMIPPGGSVQDLITQRN